MARYRLPKLTPTIAMGIAAVAEPAIPSSAIISGGDSFKYSAIFLMNLIILNLELLRGVPEADDIAVVRKARYFTPGMAPNSC